jgi:hypothetical protein
LRWLPDCVGCRLHENRAGEPAFDKWLVNRLIIPMSERDFISPAAERAQTRRNHSDEARLGEPLRGLAHEHPSRARHRRSLPVTCPIAACTLGP